MYTENDLVRLAKRKNNKKRTYLVVNQLQGKHIPVVPSTALHMFYQLGDLLKENYDGETLLLIGFAETATAIGAAIAAHVGGYYMQTTREIIEDVDYLYFTEAHSHATEQKLVKDDIDSIIDHIDRIVFIEDEVTTGNTIMNIIRLLKTKYSKKIQFSAASLLNGMNKEAKAAYVQHGIQLHYLVKTNHENYETKIAPVKDDGAYHERNENMCTQTWQEYGFGDYLNARRLVLSNEYLKSCKNLWKQIQDKIDFADYHKILVLGTEEFMFPGLFIAEQIEKLEKEVRFHATTRSPIVVSKEVTYPLHNRYELASVYDQDRTTFVYDLDKYEMVLIVTDSQWKDSKGLNSIMNALQMCGNSTIYCIRWCGR